MNFEDNRICNEINPPCPLFHWDQQLQTQRCKNLEDISFIIDLKSQNNMAGEYFSIGYQEWSEIQNEFGNIDLMFATIGEEDEFVLTTENLKIIWDIEKYPIVDCQ